LFLEVLFHLPLYLCRQGVSSYSSWAGALASACHRHMNTGCSFSCEICNFWHLAELSVFYCPLILFLFLFNLRSLVLFAWSYWCVRYSISKIRDVCLQTACFCLSYLLSFCLPLPFHSISLQLCWSTLTGEESFAGNTDLSWRPSSRNKTTPHSSGWHCQQISKTLLNLDKLSEPFLFLFIPSPILHNSDSLYEEESIFTFLTFPS
jgi:hypothetical protein